MSEGAADFLAASITGDPAWAAGSSITDEPLRELDPGRHGVAVAARHRRDPPHRHDLRRHVVGPAQGADRAVRRGRGRRAHQEAVRRRAAPRGQHPDRASSRRSRRRRRRRPRRTARRTSARSATRSAATACARRPAPIERAGRARDQCAVDRRASSTSPGSRIAAAATTVAGARVDWKPAFGGTPAAEAPTAQAAGENRFFAAAAARAAGHGALQGRASSSPTARASMLADNRADPYYELYQGRTVKLYCTDFETGSVPRGLDDRHRRRLAVAVGVGHADGRRDRSARRVLGHAHRRAGARRRLPAEAATRGSRRRRSTSASYSDVRLQYRRWLGVEDSHFDQAQITRERQAARG